MFLVVIVVVIMVAMPATLTRFLELMALLFRLSAVHAMPANGLVKVLFGFVNLPLASPLVSVVRVHRNGAAQQQEAA